MSNPFHKTREVTLKEFQQIWNEGGYIKSGAQFSNCNSHNYLWVIDKNQQAIFEAEKASYEAWAAQCPKESGVFGIGTKFANFTDWKKAFHWREKLDTMNPKLTNVTTQHSAGFVVGQFHGTSRYENPVVQLPEDWDEVFLEHYEYGTRSHTKTLVARNNHDGTVQLFRIEY